MLVRWDANKMDAQTEPVPTETPDKTSFPWLDDLQARGRWITGGFDIIECESLEEAVEIAAGHPVAKTGTIKVRPLWGK